jgi:hypothetical protein
MTGPDRFRVTRLFERICAEHVARKINRAGCIILAGALLSPAHVKAVESCYGWATELVTAAQHCASSVLPPQLGINYGPDVLFKQQGA